MKPPPSAGDREPDVPERSAGSSSPLAFIFPASVQPLLEISHEVPSSCDLPIPYAYPTLRQWPDGYMLEQSIAWGEYGICLLHFSIGKEIMLEPDAAMNFNTIQYTLKGNALCLLRGHGIIALLEDTYTPLYIPQGRHKVWFRPGRYVFLYIVISNALMNEMAGDHPRLRPMIQKILQDSRDGTMAGRAPLETPVRHILREMEQLRNSSAALHFGLESMIMRLLVAYDDHLHGRDNIREWVTPREILYTICDYITQHYQHPGQVSTDALCKRYYLGARNLERGFKHVFGLSPSEYVREIRLHAAHDILHGASVSVHEAADRVGYDHVSSFCRDFKRKYGYTPRSS